MPERRRENPPEDLSSLIPRVLDELGLGQTSLNLRLLRVWDDALGPELSPHCRPEGLHRGVVRARVPDSAWMQRLQLEKPRILARVRHALGGEGAEDLWLRIGVPEDEDGAGG